MDSLTQLRRLGLFDARVPRYTSYPSANHFVADFSESTVTGWIRAIPQGSKISLYIHIPFCRRLCWFCACRTQGTSSAAPVRGYLDVVKQELDIVAAQLPDGVTLQRLHWGGGTPTLLQPDMIAELATAVAEVAPFAPDHEFSVEIDPNEVDGDRLDALVRHGMNRASIGVQDFDPNIQATIGRPQTFAVTKDVVDGLRERGVPSLNVDILYGLPHQTEQRIADSVQKVLTLAPDRVALYGYAHVPWMARRQSMIPTEALPAPEERLELYETARRLFLWDGYEEIGIDHFARPGDGLAKAATEGTLRRNFQGYTDDTSDVLLGLGASSISRFPQGFAQNNPSTSGYHAAIRDGHLATTRGHEFTADDRIREAVIGSLMCQFSIDYAALAKDLNVTPESLASLAHGIDEVFPDMLDHDENGLRIRSKARPLTRMIARYFDAYALNRDGHSGAI
ncbi:MAG: oxygen-independent coproporphyrinogen III oxidase [Pseudomonadota bacterium]